MIICEKQNKTSKSTTENLGISRQNILPIASKAILILRSLENKIFLIIYLII